MKRPFVLAAFAMSLVTASAFADTIVVPYTATAVTFTATGTSQGLSPGTAVFEASTYAAPGGPIVKWADGAGALILPAAVPPTDWVYIYTLTNTLGSTVIENFTVQTGSTVDAFGASAGVTNFGAPFEFVSASTPNVVHFEVLALAPGASDTLAFASPGAPAAFAGSVQDGTSADALPFVISAVGPAGAGTPLPAPMSLWGGLGLFGLLVGSSASKLRRRSA